MSVLFREWYGIVNIGPLEPGIVLREQSIDQLASTIKRDEALDILRMYLGGEPQGAEIAQKFTKAFTDKDPSYSKHENVYEQQILAAGMLAKVLDAMTGSADAVALALISSEGLEVLKPIVPDLKPLAADYLIRRGQAFRQITKTTFADGTIKNSTVLKLLKELETKAASNQVDTASITAVISQYNQEASQIAALSKQYGTACNHNVQVATEDAALLKIILRNRSEQRNENRIRSGSDILLLSQEIEVALQFDVPHGQTKNIIGELMYGNNEAMPADKQLLGISTEELRKWIGEQGNSKSIDFCPLSAHLLEACGNSDGIKSQFADQIHSVISEDIKPSTLVYRLTVERLLNQLLN